MLSSHRLYHEHFLISLKLLLNLILVAEEYFIKWIHHSLSVHWLIDIWVMSSLGLLQIVLLGTLFFVFFVKTFCVKVLVCTYTFISLGQIREEWLDHIVSGCLNVWETAVLFSKLVVPFYIPPRSVWESQLPHFLGNTWYGRLLNFGHSNRGTVFCFFFNIYNFIWQLHLHKAEKI